LPDSTTGVQKVTSVERYYRSRLSDGLHVTFVSRHFQAKGDGNITYLVARGRRVYGETGMATLLEH